MVAAPILNEWLENGSGGKPERRRTCFRCFWNQKTGYWTVSVVSKKGSEGVGLLGSPVVNEC